GQLDREISRHHFYATFAHAVGGEMRKRKFLMDRTDVDYFAGSFRRLKLAYERLGGEENAFEVYRHHRVVFILGDFPKIFAFLNPGVVHQNVNGTEGLYPGIYQIIYLIH